MGTPSPVFPTCSHGSSRSAMRSRFCRNRISDVTSVPALWRNVSLGRRTAPINSHRWAMYRRTLPDALSSVPLEVMNAMIPPVRTLSMVLPKK